MIIGRRPGMAERINGMEHEAIRSLGRVAAALGNRRKALSCSTDLIVVAV